MFRSLERSDEIADDLAPLERREVNEEPESKASEPVLEAVLSGVAEEVPSVREEPQPLPDSQASSSQSSMSVPPSVENPPPAPPSSVENSATIICPPIIEQVETDRDPAAFRATRTVCCSNRNISFFDLRTEWGEIGRQPARLNRSREEIISSITGNYQRVVNVQDEVEIGGQTRRMFAVSHNFGTFVYPYEVFDGKVRPTDLKNPIRRVRAGGFGLASIGSKVLAGKGDIFDLEASDREGSEYYVEMETRLEDPPFFVKRISTFGSQVFLCGYQQPEGCPRVGEIRIYDLNHGTEVLCALEGHEHQVEDLTFSPRRSAFISTCRDTMRIWDWKTQECAGNVVYGIMNRRFGWKTAGLSLYCAEDLNYILLGTSRGLIDIYDIRKLQTKVKDVRIGYIVLDDIDRVGKDVFVCSGCDSLRKFGYACVWKVSAEAGQPSVIGHGLVGGPAHGVCVLRDD